MKTTAVAAVALLLLSGCAGDTSDEDEEAGETSAEAPEESEADSAEDTGEEPADEAGGEDLDGVPVGEPAEYAEEGMVDGSGEPADTSYEVTVDEVETLDVIEYDDGYNIITHEPQGQWVVISYSAVNTGDQPGSPSGSTSELWTADESIHEGDFEAGYDLGLARDRAMDRLNPGQEGTGLLVFDIPADAEPDLLLFRGSIEQVAAVFDLS